MNLHFDDRLQFKIGRYFVPFTFEPYVLPIHGLITPEFSLFFNNFSPNRDLGVMAWGQLARKRIDYAAGIFNGTRNALVDTNDAKDVIGFLNAKPFAEAGIPALENLNVGASVNAGDEQSPPLPRTLRTVVPIPGNATSASRSCRSTPTSASPAAGALVAPHGLLLPSSLADRRVGWRLPGVRTRE